MTPLTYGDCLASGLGTEYRLCPHVRCRHHTGQVPATCSLRVADQGGLSPAETALVLGISRQHVQVIEARALARLRGDRRERVWGGRDGA